MNRRQLVLLGIVAWPRLGLSASLFLWTNNLRADVGTGVLQFDATGTEFCKWKTRRLYELNVYGHDLPDSPLQQQYEHHGLNTFAPHENLVWSLPSHESDLIVLHKCWWTLVRSKLHYTNIVNPNHTHLGIDVYRGPDRRMYAAQLFIRKGRPVVAKVDTLAANNSRLLPIRAACLRAPAGPYGGCETPPYTLVANTLS
jgi:hypothetical protein